MSKIAVVGAGPAGCSAGYHLTRSGHDVTLIDKKCFPKDKVCGDGISIESIQAVSLINTSWLSPKGDKLSIVLKYSNCARTCNLKSSL